MSVRFPRPRVALPFYASGSLFVSRYLVSLTVSLSATKTTTHLESRVDTTLNTTRQLQNQQNDRDII